MKAMTYARLDAVLRSIGFTFQKLDTVGEYTQRCYRHPASGAVLIFPVKSGRDPVIPHHLVATRMTLHYFGIDAPEEFVSRLKTA